MKNPRGAQQSPQHFLLLLDERMLFFILHRVDVLAEFNGCLTTPINLLSKVRRSTRGFIVTGAFGNFLYVLLDKSEVTFPSGMLNKLLRFS